MHSEDFTFTKGSQITGYFPLGFSLVNHPNIKQNILKISNSFGVRFMSRL
jgi:hypothetical protein